MQALAQLDPEQSVEEIAVPQNLTYNWEYATPRAKLMRLYENAKRDQWNGSDRLDWSVDVDPEKGLVPDAGIAIYGTPIWDSLDDRQIERLRHEFITWQLCQFLHGEQGALITASQLVAAVPWIDARHYAATQTMDEARHVEVFSRYVGEKLEWEFPIDANLKSLLDIILLYK